MGSGGTLLSIGNPRPPVVGAAVAPVTDRLAWLSARATDRDRQ